MLREELAVQEGQLDGVGDRLDLLVKAADVGIGDIGYLFEHNFFELLLGQELDEELASSLEQDTVAASQADAGERRRDFDDSRAVAASGHERPDSIVEHLDDRHDLAGTL